MSHPFAVTVELVVTDRAALAGYALRRAVDCGITATEFKAHEKKAYEGESEVEYWLGWVFDNGTPLNSGIEIQETSVTDLRLASQ